MIAAQFSENRKIDLVQVAAPVLDPSTTGEIVFQPELTCLCGSDLPFFDGGFEGHQISYPQPVGMSLHEMVGTVLETNGSKWKPGTRVLAVPEGQRGFYERYILSENRVIALDDRLSDEIALLAQPLGTVVWALKKLPNMVGRDVAVIGLGPIGQMFVTGLCNLGARKIIGIDPVAERVQLAGDIGATDTICSLAADADTQVRRILNGSLPEIVIEAVGHQAQAFDEAVALTEAFGTILYFGVPPAPCNGLHIKEAMLKNLTILTSLHPDFEHTFPLAMQWLAEERIDLSSLLTHRFPLSQAQQAFDLFRDRKDGAIKVLLEFPAYAAGYE